jgi:uncharacterized protein (TIGR02266 family)
MPTPTPPAKTVVVADDTAFVRERFQHALEGAGHHAITVGSAAELLHRVKHEAQAVDLVLLDLQLPGAVGVELVRKIRSAAPRPLAIVVFSGTIGSAGDVRELTQLGVAGYINEYSAPHNILPTLAPHLFPDNFNRRSSPRVSLGIPVQYRVGSSISAALTLNLSHGGLAIRTTSPLPMGSIVQVKFRMPSAAREVEATGRVVWSDGRVGMGIQFQTVDPTGQEAIDNFVDAHFFSNRKA